MVKWRDFLNRNLLARGLVERRAAQESDKETKDPWNDMIHMNLPDNAVSTLAYNILNFILVRDVEGNLPRVALWLAAGHG
jgi:hypothetical protein